MDSYKTALGAAVIFCLPLSLQALADPLQKQWTPTRSRPGQPASDRTPELIEAYRAARPGQFQPRPPLTQTPAPALDRRGPPDWTGPASSGSPGITLPGSSRR